jgi:hypothetical protein
MIRTLLILLVAVVWANTASSQSKVIENIIPSGDDDLNYEDLYENISQLTVNPIDINSASAEALLSLGILSQKQAQDIIDYHESNGDLIELYELQSIPSLDLETINDLLPFITVRSSMPGKNFMERVKSKHNTYFFARYERTIESSRGFQPGTDSTSKYRGDPGRIYSRFRTTSPGDLSIGVTAEKDAGEQFQWNQQRRGFDFYSGHIQLMNKGPLVNIIAGDYTAQFGQGLTLGGGFGMGKGSETITTLRRSSTAFMPYSSANEAGYFRGGAVSLRLPFAGNLSRTGIIVHAFASSLPRDASVGNAEGTDNETSLSVLQSGKHRTIRELQGRHRMAERNYGVVVEHKGRSLEAGCVIHHTSFGQPINKSPTIYNSFDFAGTTNTNTGVFVNYNFQNLGFFGEASQTVGHGRGAVVGVIGSISRSIDVSLLLRHYDRDFYTFYSNAISESTSPKNESGIYWGWKHAINRRLFYTAYVDVFSFPWLRFRAYQPSAGNESLLRLNYKYSKGIDLFVQFRDERKTRNIPAEASNDSKIDATYKVSPVTRQNVAAGAGFVLGKLSLKTRVQYSSFLQHPKRSHGFAMAFDAAYDWDRFSLAARFAIFDTDDFDNRQYMNERDVLMAFSFPAYYGEGTRSYLVARYQATRWLDCWVKLAGTAYFNATSSGSGSDTIDGNKRHDVKVQLVFRMS